MKKRLLTMFFFVSFNLLATEPNYSITQIDDNQQLVAIKNEPELEDAIHKEFMANDINGHQCILPIIAIKNTYLMASTKNCSFKNELKIGQILQVSLLTGISKESTSIIKDEKADEKTTDVKKNEEITFKNENWYSKLSLGLTSIGYPSGLQFEIDRLKNTSGVEHVSIGLDIGFYWPLDQLTALGVNLNGVGDRFERTVYHIQINQYLLGLSGMKFFGNFIGDKFFVRGDIGLAWYNLDSYSTAGTTNLTSNKGLGVLVGGGYSYPINNENRATFEINYSSRKAEGSTVTTFGFMIGLLL